MVEPILTGDADLVLGSRLALPGMARANGMPIWKYLANRFLTITENKILGTQLTEAHTGFRAYSRHMLLTIPFLRNSLDFVFDSEADGIERTSEKSVEHLTVLSAEKGRQVL